MKGFLQVQQAETLGTEAQIKKGVEERVEAAVDVGQAGGVRMGQEDTMCNILYITMRQACKINDNYILYKYV